MTEKKKKKKPISIIAKTDIAGNRVSVIIKTALDRIANKLSSIREPSESIKKIRKLLKNKDKDKILEKALEKYYNKEELKPYQAELIKLQQHFEQTGRKMIILCDGRDASGKGGTIRRLARYMNEKHYRVVALGKPSKDQQTQLHIKRYVEQFPRAGEIVIFDRSWYNRAMVEPVMGFSSPEQYRRFMKKISSYDRNFAGDGATDIYHTSFLI